MGSCLWQIWFDSVGLTIFLDNLEVQHCGWIHLDWAWEKISFKFFYLYKPLLT